MKLLVLLVGDQTIPNVLFAKEIMSGYPEDSIKILFITTQKMEKEPENKRKWIIGALSLNNSEDRTDKIIVEPEKYEDVKTKISKFDFSQYNEIIVNLTGGTKMMMLAVYDFFKESMNLNYKLWYKGIGEVSYHIVNNSNEIMSLTTKIDVKEYLASCGIFENNFSEKKPIRSDEDTKLFFMKFLENKTLSNQLSFQKFLDKIRATFRANDAPFLKQMKNKKEVSLTLTEDLVEFKNLLDEIGFKLSKENILTKAEMEYLTGGWFEEFCYYYFKKSKNLQDDKIKLGVLLKPDNNKQIPDHFIQNDLDIVFVHNDEFYLVECKTIFDEKGLIQETIYKSAALRKYFGLSVKSIICTLSDLNDDAIQRANVFNIKILEKNHFQNYAAQLL